MHRCVFVLYFSSKLSDMLLFWFIVQVEELKHCPFAEVIILHVILQILILGKAVWSLFHLHGTL